MLLFSRRMNRATMWQQLADQLEHGKKTPLRSKQQPAAHAAAGPGFVNNW
jgi:hypothetical protein